MEATQRAILDAARARVTAALPGALDRSELPEGAPLARLPAFAIRAERVATTRRSMGSADFEATDRLSVSAWLGGRAGDPTRLEARISAASSALVQAIMAAPADLGGLAFDLRPGSTDSAIEAGEIRVGRCDLEFDVVYITTGA